MRHLLIAIAAATLSIPAFIAPLNAEALPLSAYGRLPQIEQIDISSDGSLTALVTEVNGRRVLLILDAAMQPITSVNLADQKVRNIDWAGSEYLLFTVSQTEALDYGWDRDEFYKTMVINLKSPDKSYWIFASHRNFLRSTFGSFGIRQINGKYYAFFGGYKIEKKDITGGKDWRKMQRDLWRIDLEDGKPSMIASGNIGDMHRSWLLGADGTVAASIETLYSTGEWAIFNASGQTLAKGVDKEHGVDLSAIGSDGSTLFYTAWDKDKNDYRYKELRLTDGAPVESSVPMMADLLYRQPATGYAIGWKTDDLYAFPTMFDADKNMILNKLRPAFLNSVVRFQDFSDDFGRLIFTTSGGTDSGTIYALDTKAKRATKLGLEYPDITPNNVGDIRTVTYTAADGLEIEAILTLPPGMEPKNLPVIIFPHGGPTSHDVPTFDWWAQAFASRGYAVLQPNFRGSTNNDQAFVQAGWGEWGRKMQTDLSDGLTYLAQQGIADPKRACIMGASYGGYAALAGVTIQNGLYRCAVSVAGVGDLPKQLQTTRMNGGDSTRFRRELEREIGTGKDAKAVSPRHLAARADAPILLIHGKDDTVVLYDQSEDMAGALKAAGKPYEFVTLEGEDHWLSTGKTRLSMLEAAMAFVLKHNPPGPAQ